MANININTPKIVPDLIGYVSTIEDYMVLLSIVKASETDNIWPINRSVPVYLKDNNGNGYLMFKSEKVSPSTDLPSLSVIDGSSVLTINPAKSFILESGLTTLVARAVIISPSSIPALMSDIYFMDNTEIITTWNSNGFDHLKLVAGAMPKEYFMNFMLEFSERHASTIKDKNTFRRSFLKVLTEIGTNKHFLGDQDFIQIIRSFMANESIAMLVEQKSQDIHAIFKDTKVKYGDLVSFPFGDGKHLMIIENIGNLLTLQPLVGLIDGKTQMSFHPLPFSTEGTLDDADMIIKALYAESDEGCFKVPVGEIPNIDDPYSILLKGNMLIHFAIIAISGRGKGNFNKKFLLEIMRQQVEFLKNHDDRSLFKGPGIVLFDDVGEYVKCLKPRDWGLDLAVIALYYKYNQLPFLSIVDISIMSKSVPSNGNNFPPELVECITPKPAKIPLEYVPIKEVLRTLKGKVAYDLIPIAMRHYYRNNPDERPTVSEHEQLSLSFVNWFLQEGSESSSQSELLNLGFLSSSINAARRALRTFMFAYGKYMGIKYVRDSDSFDYMDSFKGKKGLNDAFNLLRIALECADKGEILVLDESGLQKGTKLFIQRVVLNHILSQRESRGYDPDITPCLFIIEEATSLMRESGGSQLDLFAEVAVKARKFGIGIGLIFQNVDRIDPILLQQLGWTVIMGLPVDAMRSNLSKNVPSDIDPYDIYVKRANVGVAIGIQQTLGGSVTLPFKVAHYEADVAILFSTLEKDERRLVFAKLEKQSMKSEVIASIKQIILEIDEKKKRNV